MNTRGVLVALILTATAAFVVGVSLERHETHNEAAETPAQRAAERKGAETSTTHSEAGENGKAGESGQSGNSRESGTSGESGTSRESGESGESAEHTKTGESGESTEQNPSTETTTSPTSTATTNPKTAAPATETPQHSEASEKLLGVNPESTGLLVVAVVVSLLLAAGVWWLGASPLVLGVVALAMAAFAALDIREVVHQADESRTGLMLLAALVALLHLAAAALGARAAVTARGTQPPPTSAHAT
jgi:hypothetical protein